MLKKILIVGAIFVNVIYAQIGYVEVNHPIYKFLERMESLHILTNYNSFEIPKTRNEIAQNIKSIINNRVELNSIDNLTLNDFITEFEFELEEKTDKYYSLFSSNDNENSFLNEKEKFLYFYTDSSMFNTFVKFVGSAEGLYSNNYLSNENNSATLVTFGGEIRGTVYNNFGYFIRATNGIQYGNKELASLKSNLKYNYKIHSNNDSSNYFDETIGYLSADFDFIRFKIGRDRINLGYGDSKIIMDNYFPQMDYVSMQINYSIFSFSFIHGKLFGETELEHDSLSGYRRVINDKYIAYHRLGINFSKHFRFGIGESVIYANRNIDMSYLNPFIFYKSAEHANYDRDNSMLFFDFENNSIKGLTLYGMFLIDDVDFSKLSTNWYGNKFIYNIGFTYEPFPQYYPLTIGFQYLRIDPYVYAHRFSDNNYTSYNIGIGSNIEPNSRSYIFSLRFKPHYRIEIFAGYQSTLHGANKTDENGNVLINYGGDILVGHRTIDSDNVIFLDGIKEETEHLTVSGKYEPIKNYFITLKTEMIKLRRENITKEKLFIANLIFSIRI